MLKKKRMPSKQKGPDDYNTNLGANSRIWLNSFIFCSSILNGKGSLRPYQNPGSNEELPHDNLLEKRTAWLFPGSNQVMFWQDHKVTTTVSRA
jgi:hypothetical protein